MWVLFAALAVTTALGLMIYNRIVIRALREAT
jgi:hypothetical protein